MEITDMTVPKLPILAPRRSRDVLLLPLALHVRLLVFGGVEHRFGLLRGHSRNWLRCGSLVLTLRRRRARRVTLSPAAPAASTASSSNATSLFLTQRQLVVPPCIGV